MLAIFGGSFDPPHHAHVMVVLWALQRYENLRVMIIPAYKHALGKDYTANFDHRMTMCEKAFSIFPKERIDISDIEAKRGGTSYMIETIEALQEKYPDEQTRLLIGSDLVEELPRWHRGEEIIQKAEPLVVPRFLEGEEMKEGLLPMISSSYIREHLEKRLRIEAHKSLDKNFEDFITKLIPVNVWNYIEQEKLYL